MNDARPVRYWMPLVLGLFFGAAVAGPAAESAAEPTAGVPKAEAEQQQADRQVREQWYALLINDSPSGYAVERRSIKDGNLRHVTEMSLSVNRGAMTLEIEIESGFLETPDGEPLAAMLDMDLGAMGSTRTVYRWTDDGVISRTTQGGRKMQRKHEPIEGDWLTPMAAERFVEAQLDAGRKQFSYRTLDITSGFEPIEVTMQVKGREKIELLGRTVEALRIEQAISLMPGVTSVIYTDADGRPLAVDMNMAMFQMRMIATDEQLARAKREPAELLNATLIRMDQPVAKPRKLRKATWRLQIAEGKMPDLPQTPVQSVKRIDERTVEVTVDLDAEAAEPRDGPAQGAAEFAPPKVERSLMVDGDDPAVKKLARRAVDAAEADAKAAEAEALRRFVHDYVETKSLNVGMASASEICRTREGDCTEHAVLLAAMLRARGIPSRGVSGLVYVDEPGLFDSRHIFGYHMWTQAWLDGRWVDLDASLAPTAGFDATHIALGIDPLDNDQLDNSMVKIVPLIGALDVKRTDR